MVIALAGRAESLLAGWLLGADKYDASKIGGLGRLAESVVLRMETILLPLCDVCSHTVVVVVVVFYMASLQHQLHSVSTCLDSGVIGILRQRHMQLSVPWRLKF